MMRRAKFSGSRDRLIRLRADVEASMCYTSVAEPDAIVPRSIAAQVPMVIRIEAAAINTFFSIFSSSFPVGFDERQGQYGFSNHALYCPATPASEPPPGK